MSGSKERDEQEARKLDELFEDTLNHAKPYIMRLKEPEDNQLSRLWLEKLGRATSQRVLRNRYLFELCRHLKSGHIGGIFVKRPQNGPLKPLPRLCNHTIRASSSLSDLSDTSNSEYHEFSISSCPKKINKTLSRCQRKESSSTCTCDCSIADSAAVRLCEEIRSDRNQLESHRHRIDNTTFIVRELQIQNEKLKRELSHARQNCESKENSDNSRSTFEKLTGEITALRANYEAIATRLEEVNDMKDQLEINHRDIVDEYKATIAQKSNEFNEKLREVNSENAELKEKLTAANRRSEELINETKNRVIGIEQNYKEEIKKAQFDCNKLLDEKDKELLRMDGIISEKNVEITEINRIKREEIESLNDKIYELQEKLRTRIEDEGKLQSFIKEQCSTMKEDLTKMRTDMEIASHTQNQNLINKISALKRVILKLEKSKEKLGIECAKKISQVLETKELEIKNLQLQLEEQRSELSTSLSSEKQSELNKLVGLLEERYKGLLSATDATAGNQRKTFLKRITMLENQITLLKNSLDFDNESTVV